MMKGKCNELVSTNRTKESYRREERGLYEERRKNGAERVYIPGEIRVTRGGRIHSRSFTKGREGKVC